LKYFIISQPKSGTHLLANLLVEFGIKHSYMHIAPGHYRKINVKQLDDSVRNPNKHFFKSKFKDSLNLIDTRNFAVGHISHTVENVTSLKDFKKILITRNEEDIIKSAKRWREDYGGGADVSRENLESIRSWTRESDVFHITFEDIINTEKDKLDQLQKYIFPTRRKLENSVVHAKKAMAKDSFTKSKMRGSVKKRIKNKTLHRVNFFLQKMLGRFRR